VDTLAGTGTARGWRYGVAVDDLRQSLRRASEQYREADERLERARQALIEAVVEALRADMPPTEVVALSAFSPAHVRVIAREHGIPPARGGPRKRATRGHGADRTGR
jgi:hypothetical protein